VSAATVAGILTADGKAGISHEAGRAEVWLAESIVSKVHFPRKKIANEKIRHVIHGSNGFPPDAV